MPTEPKPEYKSYQPLNTWWAEQEIILHTEFRDGNVLAGFEQLLVFKEVLVCLPEGIQKDHLLPDTAGYQHNLLRSMSKRSIREKIVEWYVKENLYMHTSLP